MLDVKALLTKVLDALKVDYITEESSQSGWYWRKWKSGKVEAWGAYDVSSRTGSVWANNIYYYDATVAIPSGVFTATPFRGYATTKNLQWWVCGLSVNSTTSVTVRLCKPTTSSQSTTINIYLLRL